MKKRILNPNTPHYNNYGGKGLTISKEWLNFEIFYSGKNYFEACCILLSYRNKN